MHYLEIEQILKNIKNTRVITMLEEDSASVLRGGEVFIVPIGISKSSPEQVGSQPFTQKIEVEFEVRVVGLQVRGSDSAAHWKLWKEKRLEVLRALAGIKLIPTDDGMSRLISTQEKLISEDSGLVMWSINFNYSYYEKY